MFGSYRRPSAWDRLLGLLIMTASLLFDGFVFRCLWNWHVARVFHIRTLNIYEGAGFVLLVTMFKVLPKEDDEDTLKTLWRGAVPTVVCFIAGLILYWFA